MRNLKFKISRRMRGEPIAYIVGHKEFYGLDFVVNKHTLVPRPETEQLVELALDEILNLKFEISNYCVVDIGTGSGNIIISLAHELNNDVRYFATDISGKALVVAKKNAKIHGMDKKITFLGGDLLSPIIENCKLKIVNSGIIILANLPYLSKEIYASATVDVKKFEPKSALLSANHGLAHYEKLFKQIKTLLMIDDQLPITVFLEISPEQKIPLTKMIKSIFPKAKFSFHKDLAGKWRACTIQPH